MTTHTLNPVTFVDAVRRAGGHLWPHQNLEDGFIMWAVGPDANVFLQELQQNAMAAPLASRMQITCYLTEHPSLCKRPPFCPAS